MKEIKTDWDNIYLSVDVSPTINDGVISFHIIFKNHISHVTYKSKYLYFRDSNTFPSEGSPPADGHIKFLRKTYNL